MEAPTTSFSLGRAFFGSATLGSGLLQLVVGHFVRLVPKLPAWVPAPQAWAYLTGVVLVAIGLAVLSGRMARPGASLLGVLILLDVALLYAPTLVWNPQIERPYLVGFMWTNPLKALALVGGAAILTARLPGPEGPFAALVRILARLEPLGAWLLALFLVVCGVQHFVYADFVTTLVPTWIPAPRFWTYFTGVALTAGGAGIVVPKTARLAASLSALMVFLWVVLLHIPRAFAEANHAFETAGVFEAMAVSGVALLVAATRVPSDGEASRRS
jgi:uncharacterized membrane protein